MKKVLLVVLILLIGGVVVADRLAVRRAESEIARQVAAQQNLTRHPDVTIHGVPFLTQAVGGEYEQIDVAFGALTEQGVTITDVLVQMYGVTAPLGDVINGDTANVSARTATASATIPFETIRRRAPQEVRRISAQGSDLRVDGRINVLGVGTDVTVVVAVKANATGLTITPQSVAAGGTGVPIPLSAVRERLSWTVPVRDLPLGSRISRVQVAPNGVRVSATAQNVEFSELRKL